MRKYFLLSAVALLTATSANATTDYAEVTAKATIEVAGTFECSDIDFGTIVVKQGNEDIYLSSNGTSMSDDLISVSGDGNFSCSSSYLNLDNLLEIEDVSLTNESGDTLTLTNLALDVSLGYIGRDLIIPADVKAGDYTGSFTIILTY
ncbi:MAG: DUF4402 domain-containing protein [Alphaproteobacteria bacterium]|nr:DUF4402 domain-containing protein [Alphaproteobacteria bacterium]